LHEESSLYARLELFTIDVNVLEIRRQRGPDLGRHDTETAPIKTLSPSARHDRVLAVCCAKPGARNDGNDRHVADITKIRCESYKDYGQLQLLRIMLACHFSGPDGTDTGLYFILCPLT